MIVRKHLYFREYAYGIRSYSFASNNLETETDFCGTFSFNVDAADAFVVRLVSSDAPCHLVCSRLDAVATLAEATSIAWQVHVHTNGFGPVDARVNHPAVLCTEPLANYRTPTVVVITHGETVVQHVSIAPCECTP